MTSETTAIRASRSHHPDDQPLGTSYSATHRLRGNQPMSLRQPRPPDSQPTTADRSAPSETSQPDPDLTTERLAYSVDEAARLTGLSRDLLYDEMRRGNLTYVKIGRRRVITHEHLHQFLGLGSKK